MTSVSNRSAALAGRLTLVTILALAACGPSTPPPSPTSSAPTELTLPGHLDITAAAAEAEKKRISRTQVQRGYQCGWQAGWLGEIRAARREAPSAFRGDALGSALGWGFILFVLGFGGTFVLAWVLPRFRRKPKPAARPEAEKAATWMSYFKGLALRLLARLGRALRVEQFDPLLASERQRALESGRDAERQLAIAVTSVQAIGAERPERAAVLLNKLEVWRSELQSLRRRLESPGTLPHELSPDRIGPRVEVLLRAARDLRVRLEKLAIEQRVATAASPQTAHSAAPSAATPAAIDARWTSLEHELDDRPETPRDHVATAAAELPPWVRQVGLLGLVAVGLALPMLAGWMAAGAFPLFFALVFALGGLGAVIVARVYLHRAGRLPLLPGFADRIAGWLTAVCGLALGVTIISSWMSTESGLDMGDPPPVAMPDPRLLEAPLLWKGVELTPTAPGPRNNGVPNAPAAPPPTLPLPGLPTP